MINRRQKRFLSSLSALLAKMATDDDGGANGKEVEVLEDVWRRLGLDQEQQNYSLWAFIGGRDDSLAFEAYIREYRATRFGRHTCSFLYELLWEMACADGVLHKCELTRLQSLPALLGLPAEEYVHFYHQFITIRKFAVDEVEEERRKAEEAAAAKAAAEERERQRKEEQTRRAAEEERRRREEEWKRRQREARMSPLERAYAVFGCSLSDSADVVKMAYRRLAKKWHPDQLRGEGASEELILKATQKMSSINAAWELIRKERNIY